MKRAVVLSGGGTKGAYEVGVWQAIRELGIDYQVVTGTSIGSINGALMCTGDFEACDAMWRGMVMGDLMSETHQGGRTLSGFFKSIFSPGEFMRDKMLAGAVDNSPFFDFIQKNIDEEKIRKSPVDYGCVTVRNRDRKPFCMPKNEIPQGLLRDYIIASASVYPVFPMHLIGKDYFIDGMYHDNLPIDFAIRMGAGEIIAVDLHQEPQHPDFAGRPYVTYITPSEDLGGILAFDPEKIRKNIEMGYRDAMRTFGKYDGYVYCFKKESLEPYQHMIEAFNERCAQGQAMVNASTKAKGKRTAETRYLFRELEKFARGHAVQKSDYFVRGAEIAAEICGLSHETIWSMDELIREVKKAFGVENVTSYSQLLPKLNSDDVNSVKNSGRGLRKKLSQMKKERDSKYMTLLLLYLFSQMETTIQNVAAVVTVLQKEQLAALFIESISH